MTDEPMPLNLELLTEQLKEMEPPPPEPTATLFQTS